LSLLQKNWFKSSTKELQRWRTMITINSKSLHVMSNLFKIAQTVYTISGLEPCWIIQSARWFLKRIDRFWDICKTLSLLYIRKPRDMTSYSDLIKMPISTVLKSKKSLLCNIRESLRKRFLQKFNGREAVIQPCKKRRKRERERKSQSKRRLIPSSISLKIAIQTPLGLLKMHSMHKIKMSKKRKRKRSQRKKKMKKKKRKPYKTKWT